MENPHVGSLEGSDFRQQSQHTLRPPEVVLKELIKDIGLSFRLEYHKTQELLSPFGNLLSKYGRLTF